MKAEAAGAGEGGEFGGEGVGQGLEHHFASLDGPGAHHVAAPAVAAPLVLDRKGALRHLQMNKYK